MFWETAVLSGFSAPQQPGQLTAGEAAAGAADISKHVSAPVKLSNILMNRSDISGLCYFYLNNLLRPALNHGIGWATKDTPDPSFKSGKKKDAFEGAFKVILFFIIKSLENTIRSRSGTKYR
ncbi:hypothetical protein ATANTOWER_007676 [Ataeniobius toweri]|uniref:Uncharacterized protein n=1 Tax=Ataeniobius toweri TaxID=208326 RepID=A0ABU7B7Z1_9TELE|nr:hypothetical protein [Ataeniobius toweri]